jgi:DNA-binding NarL/FixJ family response regulator
VDDEPVMRELIEVTLEDVGHTVESVESGRAALERLAQQAYDLIVICTCRIGTARRSTGRSSGGHNLGRRSRAWRSRRYPRSPLCSPR